MLIIPAIDLQNGKVVRLKQGDFAKTTTYSDNPIAVAQEFVSAGATWLHIVDLDAAATGQDSNQSAIKSILGNTTAKIQLGGGIRTLAQAEYWLELGVARIVIGTMALENPDAARQLIAQYGTRVAIALDVSGNKVLSRAWLNNSEQEYPRVVRQLSDAGASCFIVTDVSRDGMLTGPNLSLLNQLTSLTQAQIIASGGVSKLADLEQLAVLNIAGAIVGVALYENKIALKELYVN